MKMRRSYTWANAPLKFHKFYSYWLWVQLALLLFIICGNLILNRGNSDSFVWIVTCLEIVEFLVFIIYCISLRKFAEIGHMMLFIYWGVRLLLYMTLAFGGSLIYGKPYSVGGLMETMIAGTFIILYYHRRRKLFYTSPGNKKSRNEEPKEDVKKDLSGVHFPKEADAETKPDLLEEEERHSVIRPRKEKPEKEEEPAVAAFVFCKSCGAKTPLGRGRCRACKAPLEES